VYLPAELDDPAHYDGDGNDAGSIRKPAPPWPTVVGVDFSEPLAPALLVQRAPLDPPTDLPGDPAPVRLVSRAPPA